MIVIILVWLNQLMANEDDNHYVLMQYEAWHGPKAHKIDHSSPLYPNLTSNSMAAFGKGYDSTDPAVIEQHYKWFLEMDLDGVILDHTNNIACTFSADTFNTEIPQLIMDSYISRKRIFTPEYQKFFSVLGWWDKINSFSRDSNGDQQILQYLKTSFGCTNGDEFQIAMATIKSNNENLFRLFSEFGKKYSKTLKIVVLTGGYEPTAWEALPSKGNISGLDLQVKFYAALFEKYPELKLNYQGHPLLLSYFGAPTDQNLFTIWEAHTSWPDWRYFTVRKMAGYVSNQLELPGNLGIGSQGLPRFERLWTWIDRLRATPSIGNNMGPSYSVENSKDDKSEAFTVTMANPAPEGWGDNQKRQANPGGDLRQNGETFKKFMQLAKQLRPKFLMINQFNEFAWPDQGWDEETTNDIEPTNLWGMKYLELVRNEVAKYREKVSSTGNQNAPSLLANEKIITPVSARANSEIENWPATGVLDKDVSTVYSSRPYANTKDFEKEFIAVWAPENAEQKPYPMVKIRLQARMAEGTVYGFPKKYTIYLTSSNNTSWELVGTFDQRPVNGYVDINVLTTNGQPRYSWGVLIIPNEIDFNNIAGPYFQIAGVEFIINN